MHIRRGLFGYNNKSVKYTKAVPRTGLGLEALIGACDSVIIHLLIKYCRSYNYFIAILSMKYLFYDALHANYFTVITSGKMM